MDMCITPPPTLLQLATLSIPVTLFVCPNQISECFQGAPSDDHITASRTSMNTQVLNDVVSGFRYYFGTTCTS